MPKFGSFPVDPGELANMLYTEPSRTPYFSTAWLKLNPLIEKYCLLSDRYDLNQYLHCHIFHNPLEVLVKYFNPLNIRLFEGL